MFKRIDVPEVKEKTTGFSYISKDGVEEVVVLGGYGSSGTAANGNCVEFRAGTGEFNSVKTDSVFIHKQDIPNLIKALQSAYDFKGE